MNWKGRRVLVTGGAGFIGSNLCHFLASGGARVCVVDALLSGSGANLCNLKGIDIHLIQADIRNVELRPICKGAEVIFNLAAQTSHVGGQSDPMTDIGINAVAQIRLIEAVREVAPSAIVVHASTRQFYGRVEHLPVSEEQPIAPPDANGISKFAGEQYWMLEHRLYGQPVVSLRLTNCYGPRQYIRDARQGFLGFWLGNVLQHRLFEVWGGEQTRDLTYSDDVVSALVAAAANPACHGRIFNVGGGPPASLRQIAEQLVRVAGYGASFKISEFPADRARIDIGSYYADDRAFQAATGWAANVTLQEGLGRSLAWFGPRMPEYL